MRNRSAIVAEGTEFSDRIFGGIRYTSAQFLRRIHNFRISTHHGRDSAVKNGVRGHIIGVRQPTGKGKDSEGEDGGIFEF